MSATGINFGITRHEGAFIESVETTEKIEKAELRGSNGSFGLVHPYNPTTSFSVSGHGTLSLTPGIGASGIDGITGGVTLIEELKRSESNNDFDGWDYSGTHYPTATTLATGEG